MEVTVFTHEDLAHLDRLLEPLAETGNTMRPDEVQAFSMALMTGPDPISTETWWNEVLGDALPLDDEHSAATLLALLEKLYAATASGFASGQMIDLILFQDGEGRDDFWTWCNAYLYALEIMPTDWYAETDETLEDLMYPIFALAGLFDEVDGEDAMVNFSEEELAQMRKELPAAVVAIYRHWQEKKQAPKITLH